MEQQDTKTEFKLPYKIKREYTEAQQEVRNKPHVNANPKLHDPPNYENLQEELARSQVIMIRHANSLSNNLSENVTEHFGDKLTLGLWLDGQASPELVDCKLSEKGIE